MRESKGNIKIKSQFVWTTLICQLPLNDKKQYETENLLYPQCASINLTKVDIADKRARDGGFRGKLNG